VEGALDEPDPQVLSSARSGDTAAFEVLVRAYQADVWRLCLHLTGDRGLADDVTQDAFIRVFRFLPRYRAESRFSTWVFAIARNCAIDELRRSKRRQVLTDRARMEREVANVEHASSVEVRDAIAALPLELREAIVLIDMLGESYKDAARVLGTPEGTIKSRVHRGRHQLAEMLGAEEEKNHDEG
jgi:RNA polymerase sigma-70 factor (ECF subfamily)